MLTENVIWGVRDKVEDSLHLLRLHEPKEGYYEAFSGGKDSIVIDDLVKRSGCKYESFMNLTSVDPPELVSFVRENYPEVTMVKPRKSMHQMIVERGFPPTGQIRYCCGDLKEHSGKGRFIVTGVRREESSSRAKYEHVEKDTRKTGKTFIRPILTWTEAEVWEYIAIRNLPYPSLYDEGFSRLGCVMCPMAGPKQMEIEAKRWPHIYKMYMGAFDKAIKRNKERGKKCTQETAQEMMDWWMQK